MRAKKWFGDWIALKLLDKFLRRGPARPKPTPETMERFMKRRLRVRVDDSKCMGAGSCMIVAPSVFKLDETKHKAVFLSNFQLEVGNQRSVDNETLFWAAYSCPYYAIILEDEDTGERVYP